MNVTWKSNVIRMCSALQTVGLIGIICTACTAEVDNIEPDAETAGGDDGYVDEVTPMAALPAASLCGASTYWYPSGVNETDSTGTQANGTINTSVRVEVRQSLSDTGLQARVCKSSGTFSNYIAFSIYDGATNSTAGAAVYNLPTAGLACSSWVNLQNDTWYSNGQMFGGIWQVVSPASSASQWGFPYGSCSVSGSPGGTCWSGLNLSMMRTCK